MNYLVRAYLMQISLTMDWEVSVHRTLDDAIAKWISLSNSVADTSAVFHIGFDRPKSKYFEEAAVQNKGKVLYTAAARYGIPSSLRSSEFPIAYANDYPVFLALDGWGYEINDPSLAEKVEEDTILENKPHGPVKAYIQVFPENQSALSETDIFDQASYVANEHLLPRDIRESLGRFLLQGLTDQPDFDICEFSRRCPPWLNERDLETLNLTVRAQNVFLNQGLKTVGDLGKIASGDALLSQPNFGKKSLDETRAAFYAALKDGPIGIFEEAIMSDSLIASFKNAISDLNDQQRDVIIRRSGLDGPPETLEELGQAFGVTRERIRQIEKKAITKLIDKYFWDDLLEQKIEKILDDPAFPIAVSGLEALDNWFRGIGEKGHLFKYLLNAKLTGKFHLVRVHGLDYLSRFKQDTWDSAVSEAKATLRTETLEGMTEDYVKSLVINLPGNSLEFADLFWSVCASDAVFVENEEGKKTLVGTGRGAAVRVKAILEASDKPLHYNEIAKAFSDMGGSFVDLRRIHNAAGEVGLLFDRGTYGLEKHIPCSKDVLINVADQIIELVENSSKERQWHCQEFMGLINLNEQDRAQIDKYIIDIGLRKYSDLANLGRLSWARSSRLAGAANRVAIHDLLVEILDAAGGPMETSAIRRELEKQRGDSENIQFIIKDPVINISRGMLGLNDRDIKVKRSSQTKLIEEIYFKLQSKGAGVHIEEADQLVSAEQMESFPLFSICKSDARFSIDRWQNLYLTEWGDSRRKSMKKALEELWEKEGAPLPFDKIRECVVKEMGRPVSETIISNALSGSDAKYDETSKMWTGPKN